MERKPTHDRWKSEAFHVGFRKNWPIGVLPMTYTYTPISTYILILMPSSECWKLKSANSHDKLSNNRWFPGLRTPKNDWGVMSIHYIKLLNTNSVYLPQFLFSLQDYIAVKEKYAKYLPHSAGRYAAKRFRKAQCPIVERLTNSLMMHGRNSGKKLLTVRIVKHSFEIIHLLTGEVNVYLIIFIS